MKKPYKVMHLNDSLNMGGAEKMILSFLRNMNRSEFIPSVCSLEKDGSLNSAFKQSNIPVFELDLKPGIDIKSILKLSNLLKQQNIRILHSHNFAPWLYGSLASAITPGVKHIHTQHSNITISKLPPKLLRSLLYLLSSHVVSVSKEVESNLLQRGFCKAKKLSTIFNGIEIPVKTKKANNDNNIHIGIVARLAPVKNHRLLLSAASILVQRFDNIRFDIIGDGPLMNDLVDYASQLGVDNIVRFWGEIPEANVALKELDIFVLCSTSEGLSISILEAMATGLPVVATNVGGNSTLIRDQLNGLLTESENAEMLASKLAELIASEQLRHKYGSESLTIVKNEFSISAMLDQYMDLYRSALKIK